MIKESRLRPFEPRLATAIKISITVFICIVMFVIVQARNELHSDSIDNDLVKHSWEKAGLAGGATFFAGIAAGSYQVAKYSGSPEILARLAVSTMSVGVEYFLFWAGLTLLSASILSLFVILLFERLINY